MTCSVPKLQILSLRIKMTANYVFEKPAKINHNYVESDQKPKDHQVCFIKLYTQF